MSAAALTAPTKAPPMAAIAPASAEASPARPGPPPRLAQQAEERMGAAPLAVSEGDARIMAGLEVLGGTLEAAVGGVVTLASGGVLGGLGVAAMLDGSGRIAHGVSDFINGTRTDPFLSQAAQAAGVDRDKANRLDAAVGLAASAATGGLGVKAAVQGASMLAKTAGGVAAANSANGIYRTGEYVATGTAKPTWASQAANAMGATSEAANKAATLAINAALAGGAVAGARSAARTQAAPAPVYGQPAFPHLADLPETGSLPGAAPRAAAPNQRSLTLPPLVEHADILKFVADAKPMLASAKARIEAASPSVERQNLLGRVAQMEEHLASYGALAQMKDRPNIVFDTVDLKVLNRDLGTIVNSRLAQTADLPATNLPATDAAPRSAATPDARQITSGKSLAHEALAAIRRNNAHQQAKAAAFPPRRVSPPPAAGRPLPVASMNGATPGAKAAMRTMNTYLSEATGKVAAARRTFEAMPASPRRDELLALTTATGEHLRRQSFRLNNQWGVGPADLSRSDHSTIAMLQTSMAKIEAGMKEAMKKQ